MDQFEVQTLAWGAEERAAVMGIVASLSEAAKANFIPAYMQARKDPTVLLICSLLVFVGIGGVNRFLTGQIGMGILYLLTAGLCLVGSIIDAVNYKKLALEYNLTQAHRISGYLRDA